MTGSIKSICALVVCAQACAPQGGVGVEAKDVGGIGAGSHMFSGVLLEYQVPAGADLAYVPTARKLVGFTSTVIPVAIDDEWVSRFWFEGAEHEVALQWNEDHAWGRDGALDMSVTPTPFDMTTLMHLESRAPGEGADTLLVFDGVSDPSFQSGALLEALAESLLWSGLEEVTIDIDPDAVTAQSQVTGTSEFKVAFDAALYALLHHDGVESPFTHAAAATDDEPCKGAGDPSAELACMLNERDTRISLVHADPAWEEQLLDNWIFQVETVNEALAPRYAVLVDRWTASQETAWATAM